MPTTTESLVEERGRLAVLAEEGDKGAEQKLRRLERQLADEMLKRDRATLAAAERARQAEQDPGSPGSGERGSSGP